MKPKLFTLLSGIALSASALLPISSLSAAEADKVPMNAPYDPAPDGPNSKVKALLVYEVDGAGNKVPVKTMKITNNSKITVYPVMRDGNEAAMPSDDNTGLYDPYDPVRTEYRGYIGYKDTDNKYYFGLKPGQTILIRVPLVFWNGARMGIVTGGQYLTPAPGEPNPLQYNPGAMTIITDAEKDPKDNTIIKNGVVMWYRSALLGPALDSPDQLLEWTIRDADYLSNPAITQKTKGEIPKAEQVNLVNYDVSYVDNMFLPVAMEALDVPVPAPPFPPGKNPQPYGWIGAINTPEDLQKKIQAFTVDNNTLLGAYFGGKGWPVYNMPKDALGGVKIPAGQNIFAQSPLAGALSSYDVKNNTFMLSSAGTEGIRINIGGEGAASSGTILTLTPNVDVKVVQKLAKGFSVEGHAPLGKKNPIQPGTEIVSVQVSTKQGVPSTVTLSKPLVASQDGCNFDFFRPVSDYASDAMIKLWFSWANYYLQQTASTPSKTAQGGVTVNSATLTFSAPQEGLIEGMQVTGPGLAKPDPTKEKGGIVILAIADDKKSVTLSQLASEDHAVNSGSTYTFIKPQPLPSTPKSLFTFNFSADPQDPARDPAEFAKKVYLIMASMAQIPKNPDPKVKTPHVLELMNNVIGGNMGFIFDTNAQRFSDSGLGIAAVIRDMIKSVLRGVTDFTKYSEFDDSKKQVWYPDPSVRRGAQAFNVFNLDPFVWFVHVKLGFSGYGFSLDDDTADVGAGEATKLHVTIGGVAGMENTDEWTIQAPYGPVEGGGNWDPDATQSFYLNITGASNTSPIVITCPKHGLSNGDEVTLAQVLGNTAANGTFKIGNVTPNTFELVGSTGNGKYTSGGRWTTGPLPFITGVDVLNVYWKLKGDDKNAGFQGAILDGPGIQVKGSVRVKQLGDDKAGQLALNAGLTNADGTPLPKGFYKWKFSGN